MTNVDLHIHISNDDKLLVNPERVRLLRLVASTGSLLKASEKMDMSYNKAWNMLEAVNKASASPVLEKVRGGKGGGGAVLTKYGQLILKEYEQIEKVVKLFKEKLNREINF
jgi:molybdate transport system regulatory protein